MKEVNILDGWIFELDNAYKSYSSITLTDKDSKELYYLLTELRARRKGDLE